MNVLGDSDGDGAFGGLEGGIFEKAAPTQHHVNGLFSFRLKDKQV